MTMTLQEATEQLQKDEFWARVKSEMFILGMGRIMIPIYDDKDELMGTLPFEQFNITYHVHQGIWAAQIVVGQTSPIIKVDPELTIIVQAVQDFYALCDEVNIQFDTQELQNLVLIAQRVLGLVVDLWDAHTLRIRVPFE